MSTQKKAFVCRGPKNNDLPDNIYPILQNGREILHVHTGGGIYEVYAKMGGVLYTGGDVVELVAKKKSEAILRNPVNMTPQMVSSIPLDLFQQDFIPYRSAKGVSCHERI